jgi:thiol:disulfide interchange protein
MFRSLTLLLFFILRFSSTILAQDSSLVSWTAKTSKISPNQIEISIHGTIKKGWHVYAKPKKDEGLQGLLLLYNDSSLNNSPLDLKTSIISINDPVFDDKPIEVAKDSILIVQKLQFASGPPHSLKLQMNYDVGDNENFIPEQQILNIVISEGAQLREINSIVIKTIDLHKPVKDCGTSSTVSTQARSSGLLNLFLLGFLGGLVALLTPCVFPMIPLTVSFFTKKSTSKASGRRNAITYGAFIFLIYVFLSLPFHFLDTINPEILNNISTSVFLNVFFFAIFMFFAFSFFGYYEITLPSALSSKADSRAGAGNVAGIFFMALTLALVSFSCTGPILGSLLAGSLTGDGGAIQLTSGMGGFGLALALPFALFALFPNWLNTLPKSGGWLNSVKVVLGFVELGLAFKFLSNADLVKHWGILKREIFIGIWIIIGVLLTLYLFGLLRFRHDSPYKKLSGIRLAGGIITALFTLYLLPGVTNTKWANLSFISGFPPPLYYSIYQKDSDCILGLNCSRDYEEGLAKAKKEGKLLLLDFTGYACVNCRRMEENVWNQPEVYQLMKDHYIVVSLYVDDKKKLPPSQQFTYTTRDGNSKEIITVGDKWATFETENFENNAQPLYAIMDTNEVLLTQPVGYTPSVSEYAEWLKCGINARK